MWWSTQNVRILPNFILHGSFKWWKMSTPIKISWFCQVSPFEIPEWSKISFWAKFSTQIKFSGFCKFSFFAGLLVKNFNFEPNFQGDSKFLDLATFHLSHVPSGQTLNLSQIFTATENFWILLHFSLPIFSERSKMSVLSQIFSTTENFRILPNFILHRSLVVKMSTLREPNFQLDSKCLDFAKFQPSQVQSCQKSKFWSKF